MEIDELFNSSMVVFLLVGMFSVIIIGVAYIHTHDINNTNMNNVSNTTNRNTYVTCETHYYNASQTLMVNIPLKNVKQKVNL